MPKTDAELSRDDCEAATWKSKGKRHVCRLHNLICARKTQRSRNMTEAVHATSRTILVCLMCQEYFGGMSIQPPRRSLGGVAPTGATQTPLLPEMYSRDFEQQQQHQE